MSFPQHASQEGATARVLSFEEARHTVEVKARLVCSAAIETVDLLQAMGRALAEEIVADRDFPPFQRSTRDGYAVRSADVAEVPCQLRVAGELKAGDSPDRFKVDRGEAVAIMTGAPLPMGADAVVMVEHTTALDQGISRQSANGSDLVDPSLIEVGRSVSHGDNFVPRGAEARAGQPLLRRGDRLDHSAIAISASVGKSRVQVFTRPRVAILSTGDELVSIEALPGPAQIRNSNSYSLAAQVLKAGGEAVQLAVAPDEPTRLRALIEEGLSFDLLLLTGGVSMGKYDLVEQVLSDLHAEFYFTGASIQPGKPIVFGSIPWGGGASTHVPQSNPSPNQVASPPPARKYFFGLPGNPVSTMVTFELFAKPMLEALSGRSPVPLRFPSARLKNEIRTKTGLKRFLPAVLTGEFEQTEVELARWQGSGDIAALAKANCYIVIPPDRDHIKAGEFVSLLML